MNIITVEELNKRLISYIFPTFLHRYFGARKLYVSLCQKEKGKNIMLIGEILKSIKESNQLILQCLAHKKVNANLQIEECTEKSTFAVSIPEMSTVTIFTEEPSNFAIIILPDKCQGGLFIRKAP